LDSSTSRKPHRRSRESAKEGEQLHREGREPAKEGEQPKAVDVLASLAAWRWSFTWRPWRLCGEALAAGIRL